MDACKDMETQRKEGVKLDTPADNYLWPDKLSHRQRLWNCLLIIIVADSYCAHFSIHRMSHCKIKLLIFIKYIVRIIRKTYKDVLNRLRAMIRSD